MEHLGHWGDRPLTISLKPNGLTVSLQHSGRADVYSFDAAGRLWTALHEGVSYRRGLNGKVIAKWKTAGRDRDRRWLTVEESDALLARANHWLCELLEEVHAGQPNLSPAIPAPIIAALETARRFDLHLAHQDALAFAQVYRPVGILPPDQYMALTLQATEGCSFNTCTFCDFYRDRPFRIKTPEEFQAHARAVKDYLGAGLTLRRTIFLGDANALVVPMRRLVPLVEIVHREFDVEQLGGIYAFLDGFSGERKTRQEYSRLVSLGFKRVYLGLESGHDPLLQFLKKPGSAADCVAAVRAMKDAGLAVGVIVLLGAGGRQYAAPHVRDTVRAINAMELDMDDLIYFSELVESEGMAYVTAAYQAGLKPLTPAERARQAEEIESQLRFSAIGGTPHISRYDIREFVY